MKDLKVLIGNLMDVQINYYTDREEIRSYLENQPVVSAMLETYTAQIDRITDVILDDILEIPYRDDEEEYKDDYPFDFERAVCFKIMDHTINSQGEYRAEIIDLLMNWKSIGEFTKKVESGNWFSIDNLLKEHKAGYPTYQETLEKNDSE